MPAACRHRGADLPRLRTRPWPRRTALPLLSAAPRPVLSDGTHPHEPRRNHPARATPHQAASTAAIPHHGGIDCRRSAPGRHARAPVHTPRRITMTTYEENLTTETSEPPREPAHVKDTVRSVYERVAQEYDERIPGAGPADDMFTAAERNFLLNKIRPGQRVLD